jgi:hypothetical protein
MPMPPDPRRDRPSRRNLRRLWQAHVDGKLCRIPRERLEHKLHAEKTKAFLDWVRSQFASDPIAWGQIWLRLTTGDDPGLIKREMSHDAQS